MNEQDLLLSPGVPKISFGANFTRRDFIKLSAIVAAATIGARAMNAVENPEDPNKRFDPIVTRDGTFYPSYELHTGHFNLPEGLSSRPKTPVAHFNELSLGDGGFTAKEFLTGDPILYLKAETGNEREQFGRMFPDATLDFFAKHKMRVAFEGIAVPKIPAFRKTNVLTQIRYGLVNHLAQLAEMMPGWFVYARERDALWRLNTLLSELQPENVKTFFRDLVFARKLQTIAQHYSGQGSEKPVISFLLGFSHERTSELLILEEEFTLKSFLIYPKAVLQQIVDANGGIDAFCTTLVAPVKPNLDGVPTQEFATDTQLQALLRNNL